MSTEGNVPSTTLAQQMAQYDVAQDFQMDQEDIITPRLVIRQPNSPQVAKKECSGGDVQLHNAKDIIIPEGEVKDIIILAWWKEWVEWNPNRKADERILNRTIDPLHPLVKECRARLKVQNDEGKMVNKVTETYNALVIVPEVGYEEQYIMSFSRTHHFQFKQMLNVAKRLKRDFGNGPQPCPIFSHSYGLSTELVEKDNNVWYIPKFGDPTFIDNVDIMGYLFNTVQEVGARLQDMKEQNSVGDLDDEVVVVTDAQVTDTEM